MLVSTPSLRYYARICDVIIKNIPYADAHFHDMQPSQCCN